jgi:hypothetical protein
MDFEDDDLIGPSQANDRLMGQVIDIMVRLSREEIDIEVAMDEVKEIFSFEAI